MSSFKVNFAIVGTNTISDKVIAGGRFDSRFVPYAVYSRSEETGRAFAHKHNIDHVYTSYDQMLSDDRIDAVYIASPNALHCEQSIAALKAGKHVLCEKTFASNTREVRQMVQAAQNSGKLLMEAMKTICTPNFLAVKRNLHRIGKVRGYFSAYCQYSSRYDKFREGVVLNAFRPELSNGSLVDIGVYTIYPMVALFGRPDSLNANVFMLSSGVDGHGNAIFNYGDMEAAVIYSKVADSFLPTEIQGEDGTIILDRINIINTVTLRLRSGEVIDLTEPHIGDDYFYEIQEFINVIERRECQSSINTLDLSLSVMEALCAIRESCGIIYPADNE